jgi:hypothetical protein
MSKAGSCQNDVADASMVDLSRLNLETAMTVKMKQEFPGLPDHLMMKLIPHLEMVRAEDFGARLPWNRHKRRRLLRAKKIILHIFAGPDSKYWEKQCASADTEILCVDIGGSHPANLHDKNVYGFLLALCASGRVRAIVGGPPCRTLTALRYQDDGGAGVLRNDEHPYGLPDLSPTNAALVEEVRSNLNVWEPSLRAEFEQLVKTKGAVTQISKSQLQELAHQRGLPIELLPAEMVHTRKAGSGACRSRAVVCVWQLPRFKWR